MATITVSTENLRKAARWATPGDTTVPVLANVRVSVTGGQLVLAVYDWEDCRMARFPGPGDGGTGTVLVPHKSLTAAIGTLPRTGQVEVRVEGTQVDLLTGPSSRSAPRRVTVEQDCDPAAYPALPVPPPPSGWCDAGLLAPALLLAAGCTGGSDRTLPAIQSARFALAADRVRVEATNRYVMMTGDVPCTRAEGSGEASWLIPGPPVAAFARACAGGPVFLGAPPAAQAEGMAMLADSWHVLVFKTRAGEFPNFASVTGKMPEPRAAVTCDAPLLAKVLDEAQTLLAEAVDGWLAGVLADEDDKRKPADKRFEVGKKDGLGMFVQVNHREEQAGDREEQAGDREEQAVVFAVHPFTGAELGRWELAGTCEGDAVVSLNPAQLARLLPGSGQVTVRLAGPIQPAEVTAADMPGYQGIIQPIKDTPPARAEDDDKEEVTV